MPDPTIHPSALTPPDQERDALRRVVTLVDDLDWDTRVRIVRALTERYGTKLYAEIAAETDAEMDAADTPKETS